MPTQQHEVIVEMFRSQPSLAAGLLVDAFDIVPVVTDLVAAKELPERAVLSALAHADGPQADQVLTALLAGLLSTDDDRAKMYYDLVVATVPKAAQHRLEELMKSSTFKYEYQSDFARKYVAEGRTEGRTEEAARLISAILRSRGIAISEDARARIEACADIEQLETWTVKAVTVESETGLFD